MVLSTFTLGSLLLGLALAVVVVLVLTRPFMRPVDEDFETDEQIESLLAQKDALLQDLRGLDDDMEAGKVAPELYAHDRPLLLKRAALVLQQLDKLGYIEPVAAVPAGTPSVDVDAQIEAAVRKLRSPAEVDADIEAAVRRMREQTPAATNGAATRYCPQCGTPVDAGDRFCATCGHALTPQPQAVQSA